MAPNRRHGAVPPRARLALDADGALDEDSGLEEDSALNERTMVASASLAELQAALQALSANEADPALDERTDVGEAADAVMLDLEPSPGQEEQRPPLREAELGDEPTSLFDRSALDALLRQHTLGAAAHMAEDPAQDDVLHEQTVIMAAPAGLDEETVLVSREELDALLYAREAASPLAALEADSDELLALGEGWEDEDALVEVDEINVVHMDLAAPAGFVLVGKGEETGEDEPTGIVKALNPRLFGGVSAFPFAMAPGMLDGLQGRRRELRLVPPAPLESGVVLESIEVLEVEAPAPLSAPEHAFPVGAVRAERRAWLRQALG